jgi:ribonucleotide monophosphatase NagD (HAD superfamily)
MMQEIKGLLFDIGGALYVGDQVIEGTPQTVRELGRRFPMRFLTNTTRRIPGSMPEKLHVFGFDVEEEQLFTALRVRPERSLLHAMLRRLLS